MGAPLRNGKKEKLECAAGWRATKQQEIQYLQSAEGQILNTPHPNLSYATNFVS